MPLKSVTLCNESILIVNVDFVNNSLMFPSSRFICIRNKHLI